MKKICFSIATVTGLLLGNSMSCFAGESVFCSLKPYVGLEIIQTSMKFKDRYGSNIFKKNPVDYNIFAGLNFTELFGVEAGFESHKKLTRTARIVAGDYYPGRKRPLPDGYTDFSTSFESYHPYLGLTVNHNLANFGLRNISVYFMLGTSFSKIKAEQTEFANEYGLMDPVDVVTYKQSKIIPIVNFGVSYFIKEHLSMKGSVNWKKMSRFNLFSNPSYYTLKLKDSYGVGLSLIYSL